MADIKYRSRFNSLNGQQFTLEIWDTDYIGTADIDMAIGEGGCEISYDASGDKKFNDICASTMTWSFVIKNDDDRLWIKDLIEVREEKEIYAHLYQRNYAGVNEYMWGGYVLMDLSTTPDTPFPYDVELRAVDGLALLKEQRWMRSTATGFTEADTYIGDDKQRFIYWFKEILAKSGAAEISNGAPADYRIATVNRWFNENHEANSNLLDDPTYLTYCTTKGFYAQEENGNYKPDNAYNVLVGMLRSWGMRLTYWMGTYNFVQVNEFITPESGTIAIPSNMMTHYYNKAGVHTFNSEHIGDNEFARYELTFNANETQGLQKLEGTEFTYLPAIKNSVVEFESIEDVNYFQGYPEMFTEANFTSNAGTGIGQFKSVPLGTWTDPHTASGWYFYLVMNLQGAVTNPQWWGGFQYVWTIRAREVGTSPWTYQLDQTGNTLSWVTWGSLWGTWTGMTIVDLINGLVSLGGVVCPVAIPAGQMGSYNSDTLIFNSGTTTNGRIPEPSWSAIGDWEFELCTGQVNRGAAQGQNGFTDTRRGWGNQSVGSGSPIGIPTAFAKSTSEAEIMTIEYADSIGTPNQNGTVNYNSVFSAIMSASNNIGFTMLSTYVSTNTTDSKTNIIKGVKYGDTTTPNAPGTLWVESDSTGLIVSTEPTGLWGRSVIGGTDSFSELLAKQAIQNQYHSNPVLNGTVVLSSENNYKDSGIYHYLKQPNPIGRLVDLDGNPFVMQRMKWNLGMDEWEGSWWGVINSHVGTTTTSTGGGVPDNPDPSGLANPGGNNGGGGGGGTVNAFRVQAPSGTQSKIGMFDGATSPLSNTLSRLVLTKTSAIVVKGLTTSIPISNMLQGAGDDYAFLKTGMKLLIIDTNYFNVGALMVTEIVVAADQVLGDTTLTIDAITVAHDIQENAIIELDIHQVAVSAFESSSGGTQNFSFVDCSGTTLSSATSGEGNAVAIAYDIEQTPSPINNVTLYGSGGVGGVSGGEYSWSCDKIGYWQFSWNVGTNTSVQNNRILTGVKLQSGIVEGEAITWTDLEPSHSYIYDRGVGTVRKGSASNQFILNQAAILTTKYYRLVLWKEASSNASTKAITLLNGTNLIIKEI